MAVAVPAGGTAVSEQTSYCHYCEKCLPLTRLRLVDDYLLLCSPCAKERAASPLETLL